MTPLSRAKQVLANEKRRDSLNPAVQRLAIAYFRGEVTPKQASIALFGRQVPGNSLACKMAYAFRNAVLAGKVTIRKRS